MSFNFKRNPGALIGGSILIAVGLLALLGQIFNGFHFWSYLWPLIIMAFGGLFFIGMFAGGKSVAGLAVPGSIIGMIGLMMLVQSLTGYWQSWAYGWTVILFAVGLGVFIMGLYRGEEHSRQAGLRVMKVGGILFIIFGGFFELIFNAFRPYGLSQMIFPALLILLGVYLVVSRAGLLPRRKDADEQPFNPAEPKQ